MFGLQEDCSQSFLVRLDGTKCTYMFLVSSLVLCPRAFLISHFWGNVVSSGVFVSVLLNDGNTYFLISKCSAF